MKYAFIHAHRERYPVRLQCEVLGVSRGGYYTYQAQAGRGPDAEHQELLAEVQRKINALERGEKVSSIELLEFMHLWLSDHIMTSDRQVADLCQGK